MAKHKLKLYKLKINKICENTLQNYYYFEGIIIIIKFFYLHLIKHLNKSSSQRKKRDQN
jgi:hypothetical protein